MRSGAPAAARPQAKRPNGACFYAPAHGRGRERGLSMGHQGEGGLLTLRPGRQFLLIAQLENAENETSPQPLSQRNNKKAHTNTLQDTREAAAQKRMKAS